MRAVERTRGLVSYAAADKLASRNISRFMVRVRVRSEQQASIGAPGSWRGPAGESPVQVRGSARLVASVALWSVTTTTKRTQRSCGVWD